MLNPLSSPLLSQFPVLKHAFFTRQGGVSQGVYASLNVSTREDDPKENIQENLNRITTWFDGNPLALMHQIHENDVLFVTDALHTKQLPHVDGLITNTPNFILGVKTADCIPLLLADPENHLIGAVHSGWRGTVKNIVAKAINLMRKHGANKIYTALGPAIDQKHFEVGPEVYEAFVPQYQKFFSPSPSPNHYLCDLKGIVAEQLRQEGVHMIEVLSYDTYSKPDLFFSCRRSAHRGEKLFGGQLSAIMMTKK